MLGDFEGIEEFPEEIPFEEVKADISPTMDKSWIPFVAGVRDDYVKLLNVEGATEEEIERLNGYIRQCDVMIAQIEELGK